MTSNASNGQFSNSAVCERETDVAASMAKAVEKLRSLYRADQQEKFLDLQAETESLLQQLQQLRQQRLTE